MNVASRVAKIERINFYQRLVNRGFFLALILTLFIFALPAQAENANNDGRYTMSATDNGFVRLDKVTGTLTFCKESGNNLVCKLAADERQALENKIEALEDKLAHIERNSEKEYGLHRGDENLGPVEEQKSWEEKEQEMEKALSFGEKMIRRFFRLFRDLEAEQTGEPKTNT